MERKLRSALALEFAQLPLALHVAVLPSALAQLHGPVAAVLSCIPACW